MDRQRARAKTRFAVNESSFFTLKVSHDHLQRRLGKRTCGRKSVTRQRAEFVPQTCPYFEYRSLAAMLGSSTWNSRKWHR